MEWMRTGRVCAVRMKKEELREEQTSSPVLGENSLQFNGAIQLSRLTHLGSFKLPAISANAG